jgi:hypothetical protein
MEDELDTLDCESAANELDGNEEIALGTSHEIIQSILRSAKAQERSLKEHGNLTYLPSYWLHEGKFTRKIAQAVIVRRHRNDSYRGTYFSVQFWKRQKLSESFNRVQNIQFSMEETQGLLTYLREAAMTADSDENTYVLLPAAEIIDNLDDIQRQTFVNILSDLVRSRRVAELFTSGQLTDETVKHLAAAAQQVKYKAALNELSDMIEGITKETKKNGKTQPLNEHSYQEWFEAHAWVFGTEYIRRIDIRAIDPHASVDFILETADGFFDVLELKTLGAEVLAYDKSHKTWYFSTEVAKVIAQAAKYLNAIERNADMIYRNSRSRIMLVRPRVRVVIGRSKDWDDDQREAFRRLGATLHSIDLMTFDHVIQRAQKLIAHYESQSELS